MSQCMLIVESSEDDYLEEVFQRVLDIIQFYLAVLVAVEEIGCNGRPLVCSPCVKSVG